MADSPLRKLRLPVVFALGLGVAYAVTYSISPDGTAHAGTPALRWMLAATLAALGVVGVRMTRLFVLDVVFYRTQGHRAPALVHVVLAIVMYFVLGLVIAGGVFDQSLTGAIATSAVASVVLGLALQETLGNFFAGIALQIEQPFRLGDVVTADDKQGRVQSFNWRATTIQTADDASVVIPNAVIAREAVEVFARTLPNRRSVLIPAPYGTPPQRVARILRQAISGLPGIAETPSPQVRLASFDDSSVGYEILYWTLDYLRTAAIDAQLRERVWYAFAREDISIPYPHEVQVPFVPSPSPVVEDRVAERARWLGEVGLLAPLSTEERRWLAERTRTLIYGPGETILRSGNEGSSMFVVLRGRVEILIPSDAGRLVSVAEMAVGEVIGEMSLLTGEPRSADVRALGEVELVEVSKPELKELLAANEALASAFASEMSLRLEQRSDALAPAADESGTGESQGSLVYRIRSFFDLS